MNGKTFCRDLCRQWDVPLSVRAVAVPESGASLENRARIARYEAFSEALAPGECLLLAHHLDDQMETMLLRLSRGAGTRGLSGIPATRKLGEGIVVRPFLRCPREALADYAKAQNLRWIEDASNRNTDFDRNFCRHEILPAIERRWPDFRREWERSRKLITDSHELLTELAELDIERCAGKAEHRLRVDALRQLSAPRLHNTLRHWIEKGINSPADPRKLRNLPHQLIASGPRHKRRPRFPQPSSPPLQKRTLSRTRSATHRPGNPPDLEPVKPRPQSSNYPTTAALHAIPTARQWSCGQALPNPLPPRGGETCRLARRPTKSLKKILNESRIEPWLRNRLPLLFDSDNLVAIPGIGITESATTKPGYRIEWHGP